MAGVISCLRWVFKVKQYDFVYIHREIIPLGPPVFEWIIAKVYGKRIIFDFDDAIWLNEKDSRGLLLQSLKYPQKVKSIFRWSYKVSCGNSYLAEYARRYHSNVIINPTTIDTYNYHIPSYNKNHVLVIGWTGTHSTLSYLVPIIPVLTSLMEKYEFVMKIICDTIPSFDISGLQYIPWTKQDEIKVLNSIDIGLMPLQDGAWARGKCGFKILQYMALEKATVASAVGVNKEIIDHGLNGLLCEHIEHWTNNLSLVLEDQALRTRLGKNGRKKVIKEYSLSSNRSNFQSLFR